MARRKKTTKGLAKMSARKTGADRFLEALDRIGIPDDPSADLTVATARALRDGSMELSEVLAQLRVADLVARADDRSLKRRELDLRAGGKIIDITSRNRIGLLATKEPSLLEARSPNGTASRGSGA